MFKAMIAAITGDAAWTDDSLMMPGFNLGTGADYFGVTQPQVPVQGRKLLSIVEKHSRVILQHWPRPEFIQRLHSLGVRDVYLWCDLDALPTEPYWSPLQREVWVMMTIFRTYSTKMNRWGNRLVDVYETAVTPLLAKPHAFSVDLTAPYIDALAGTLRRSWDRIGYPQVGAKLYLDNVMERPYYGTASNAPEITRELEDRHRVALTDLTRILRQVGFDVMGNCGSTVRQFPSLAAKFDELYFAPSSPANRIDKARQHFEESQKAGLLQDLVLGVDGASVLPGNTELEMITERCTESQRPHLGLVTARTGAWLLCPRFMQN